MVIDPGNWNDFIYREDNKGLTILELKTKYLQERLQYDNYRSFLLREFKFQQQMQSNSSAAGAGGGPKPSENGGTVDPSENSYVVNDYIDNYFV